MPENLAQLQKTILSGTTNLGQLLNVPFAPMQVAGFVAEGIFKAIRVGRAVRAAQVKRSDELEARVRARGVIRTTIAADLTDLELFSFFTPITMLSFPLLQQLEPEIQEFRAQRLRVAPATLRLLRAARQLAPILKEDPQLERTENADLRQIFSISLTSDPADFRVLVSEYVELLPEDELSYQQHYERMQRYWQGQLAISTSLEREAIDALQDEQQRLLDEDVRQVVREAIFGDDGAVADTLGLAVRLKRNALEEEIADLKASRQAAADKNATDARLAKLEAHLERLTV